MQNPGDKWAWRPKDNPRLQADDYVELLSSQQYLGAGLKPAPTAMEITSGKLLYALSVIFCSGLIISALVLLIYKSPRLFTFPSVSNCFRCLPIICASQKRSNGSM